MGYRAPEPTRRAWRNASPPAPNHARTSGRSITNQGSLQSSHRYPHDHFMETLSARPTLRGLDADQVFRDPIPRPFHGGQTFAFGYDQEPARALWKHWPTLLRLDMRRRLPIIVHDRTRRVCRYVWRGTSKIGRIGSSCVAYLRTIWSYRSATPRACTLITKA